MQTLTRAQRSARRRHNRRVRKAKRQRRELIREMGGRCNVCGYRWRLEFNHLVPRTWRAKDLGRWTRIKRYREEWQQGKIDLRCSDCNKKGGKPKNPDWQPAEWVDEIGD